MVLSLLGHGPDQAVLVAEVVCLLDLWRVPITHRPIKGFPVLYHLIKSPANFFNGRVRIPLMRVHHIHIVQLEVLKARIHGFDDVFSVKCNRPIYRVSSCGQISNHFCGDHHFLPGNIQSFEWPAQLLFSLSVLVSKCIRFQNISAVSKKLIPDSKANLISYVFTSSSSGWKLTMFPYPIRETTSPVEPRRLYSISIK